MRDMKNHLFAVLLALLATGCASLIPVSSYKDKAFPTVSGKNLEGQEVQLPAAVAGEPAILLIAYKQNAQFDVDRWALGLAQAKVDAKLLEVPTITGFVPSLLSGTINSGMREGIPSEDWRSVVTVFEDGEKIQAMLGNENPRNAQVVVLNREGKMIWFDNRGYSPRLALEVKALLEDMR